ncbi:hypothetical protein LTR47_006624 [Exophiala xenobiotica]|nr:hypothetical protein LTR47_006624 [Exophiala xenobiotica]KAK5245064.1 hypothetical protein LTS06_009467 [Exophiala xenobiotica]KAK5349034.1 hypothetical protein LTR61_007072 [Exophiala xenobiotica]KAK5365524.1 hypothetical protein LTR11_008406 [Exophiala xenobiotica]KAK5372690.1 hypothetical protein LTS03_006378 [Exophiala xenobiotica]
MGRRRLAGVALAAHLVSAVFGYGTTISIPVSYCPATYTSATTTSSTSSTPSSTPIVLAILQSSGGQPQYVAADGTLTNDSALAVDFTINPTGQLMGAGGYISTDGNETSATFEVSPTVGSISTVFSLVSNDTLARRDEAASTKILVWRNRAFIGGEAIFCIFGSILEVAFHGETPAGCLEVLLEAIPVSDLPGTSSTTTASQSSMTTGITTTISAVPTTTSSSLSHMTEPTQLSSDDGHMSSSLFSPSSLSYGSFTTSPGVSSGTATSRVIQTTNMGPTLSHPSSSNSPNSAPMSSTTSGYPAPTTTGTPNCYDRSPYDGTVNDDYLILCDTDLSGYDLERVAASDIADCIDQCNSFIPSSQGPCVAVAFDILADTNPCALKYNISEVYRGADEFSQAAVLVNQPYSPEIVFADTSSSSSASSTDASSTTPPPETTTTELTSSPSSVSSTSVESPPPVSTTTTANPNTSSPTSIGTSTQQHASSPTTSATQSSQGVASSTTGHSTSPSSSTSSPTTSPGSTQQPSSTATSTIQQQSSSISSSRQSSSSMSTPSTTSPAATSTTTAVQTTSSPASSSPTTLRSSTSAVVATVSSTISSSSLTTRAPTSTTTLPFSTTTTTPSYCSATPTTTALCPTYNHQALNVNGDGSCYEVECSTTLQGNILNGNSTTASSLNTCVSYCTLYNVAVPYGCVGVNYLGSLAGSSPNCILMSAISSTTSGVGIDSARLLYPGYPAISDPVYTTTTSSTMSPIISTSSTSSTSATQTTGTGTSTTTSTTSTSPLSCPAAPTASSCPAGTSAEPYCYAYTNYGNTANFEVECQTSFTGSAQQPLIAYSLEDCVSWCQYANILVANSCVGLTFQEGTTMQGGSNNCFRYSSLTCATRGNATFDSARLLYAGYPAMTDYGGGFNCPS